MKGILVVGAMAIEIDGLIKKLNNCVFKRVGPFSYTVGELGGMRVICACVGVGKVNSASAVSAILSSEDVSFVINLGVAGGVGKNVRQGDVVISTRVVQHDYDQRADGLELGQVNGFSDVYIPCSNAYISKLENALKQMDVTYHSGVIASGDQFICDKNKAEFIRKTFDALACDMESGAVAQVCSLYNVDFISMRAISDGGDDGAVQDFYQFLTRAAEISIGAVTAFIKSF